MILGERNRADELMGATSTGPKYITSDPCLDDLAALYPMCGAPR